MTINTNNTPEAPILAGFDIYWKGIAGVEQAKELLRIAAGQKGH